MAAPLADPAGRVSRAPGLRDSGSCGQLDTILAALADPHRRQVVDLLSAGPRRAGELASAAGLSPPAMSRHLRTLRAAGLVEQTHPVFDERVRVYRLRPEPMSALKAWLERSEAMWAEQLAAFKVHLEGETGP